MLNAVARIVILPLLIVIGLSRAQAETPPPFVRTYAVEAKVCPVGQSGSPEAKPCVTARTPPLYYGFHCTTAIQVDQPMMQRLLAMPATAFGFTSERFAVTLTCVETDSGREADL